MQRNQQEKAGFRTSHLDGETEVYIPETGQWVSARNGLTAYERNQSRWEDRPAWQRWGINILLTAGVLWAGWAVLTEILILLWP